MDDSVETRARKRMFRDLLGPDNEDNDQPSENNINGHNRNDDNTNVGDSGSVPKRKKVSVPRILDGKYFTIISNDDGIIIARCETCLEARRGNLLSTGNYRSHYRLLHNELYQQLDDYLRGKGEETSKTQQPTLESFIQRPKPDMVITFMFALSEQMFYI